MEKVLTDSNGFVHVGMLVHIDVAYSLSMSQDWNPPLCLLHYLLHQLVPSPRDHQVNLALHREQFPHLLSAVNLNKHKNLIKDLQLDLWLSQYSLVS